MAHHIRNLVQNIVQKEENWKIKLLNAWPTIVGNLNTHVRLEKVLDDALVLSVPDACWMQELHLLSDVLIRQINTHLDTPRIKRLRFSQTGITPKKRKKKKKTQSIVDMSPVVLNKKEKHALHKITDPQLKEALEGFLIRCYREN